MTSRIHDKAAVSRRMASSVFLAILVSFVIAADARTEDVALEFGSDQTNEDGIPAPWQLLGHPRADEPDFQIEKDAEHGRVLRLHAKGNQSDGIYRPVSVDLAKTPFVNFSWKVKQHPGGQVGTDKSDQAVKVQLDFGRFRFRRRVLSYVFDPTAKAGRWYDDSSIVAANRALVLDSGAKDLGEWLSHSRNVAEDYRRCYRSRLPTLKNVSIFCDSNDSDSESLGYCSEITFSQGPLNSSAEKE